jgi:hypothetical protein
LNQSLRFRIVTVLIKLEMKKLKKIRYIVCGLTAVLLGIITLGVYARIWEWTQPRQEIEKAVVSSIEPYYHSGGDLHWSSRGNRIYIQGENRPIDFPSKNWNNTVREGDTINLIVKKSFPLFGDELDGLNITTVKE